MEANQIRILIVTRNSSTLELASELRHVNLGDPISYTAISYTWACMKDTTHRISIGGKWIDVGKNAFDVLQDRAVAFEKRSLWIDCICINQSDDNEKSMQVPMMVEIYRRAMRTIVWLGQSPDAAPSLSLLFELQWRQKLVPIHILDAFESASETVAKHVTWGYVYWQGWDSRFASLARLLLHEWFFRVWILQEMVFSGTIHVRCGGCWFDWKDFSNICSLFAEWETATLFGRDEWEIQRLEPCGLARISQIDTARRKERMVQVMGSHRPRLSQILCNIMAVHASDPRDLIYGHLNLSREAGLPEFAPDYANQKNAPDLYNSVAKLFLRRCELQEILYVAGIGYKRKFQNLPSWVPDWTSLPIRLPLRGRDTAEYNACNYRAPEFNLLPNNMLSVNGILFDRIDETAAEPFFATNSSNERLAVYIMKEVFQKIEAQKMADKLPDAYVAGGGREDALWRTLIGDTGITPFSRAEKVKLARFGEEAGIDFPTYGIGTHFTRPAPAEYSELFKKERDFYEIARYCEITPDDLHKSPKRRPPMPLPPGRTPAEIRLIFEEFEKLSDSRYRDAFGLSARGRRFAVTEAGYMALVPELARPGDVVAVIFGLEVPFLLRKDGDHGKVEEQGTYQLVGECYVHGIMDGEVVKDKKGTEMEFRIL